MKNQSLKPGWRRVKFGDIVRQCKAQADPVTRESSAMSLEHLDLAICAFAVGVTWPTGVTFTSVFQPGQVLFGKRRAYQRKVAVADLIGYVLRATSTCLKARMPKRYCLSCCRSFARPMRSTSMRSELQQAQLKSAYQLDELGRFRVCAAANG